MITDAPAIPRRESSRQRGERLVDRRSPGAAVVVSRWITAFNARDLDSMLACLATGVEFRPLVRSGLDGQLLGHAGVKRWFAHLESLGIYDWLEVADVRCGPDGQVFTAGELKVAGSRAAASFCGLYRVTDGEIVSLRHYYSDPATMRRIGLLTRRVGR